MSNQKTSTSWTVVIVMLIIFWPIGLFLLFTKLSKDRSASFGGGSGPIKFVAVFLIVIGVAMFISGFSDPELGVAAGIAGGAMFGLPGYWLLKKSKAMKEDGIKNRAYINYIVNNQIHDIHEVARRMGVSQDEVIKDVNQMISHGMLGRARLNLNTGKIEFPRPKPRPEQRPAPQRDPYAPGYQNTRSTPTRDVRSPHQQPRPTQPQFKAFEPKTIRCTACSANNFVESLPAQCEYCGTSLHEKK